MSGSMRRVLTLAGTVVLAVVLAIGYVAVDTWFGSKDEPSGPVPPSVASGEIEELLARLTVAPEAPMTGYSREKFPHWDRNLPEHGFGDGFAEYSRCTTRDVMMLRDAVGSVRLDPKTCELIVGKGGGWQDEYGFVDRKTGELRPYKKMEKPSDVDAEHIVALAEAWRSGAAGLDEDTRRRIANDAVNLVAADPSANRSKGDQDAANYLPPGKFRCTYVDRYLHVKVKYGLTVDPAEQAALRTAVDDCVRQGAFR
ncbi:HNH endonuclease family protein [Prescottella subtropica]|uniref:HNH endonuclease family protein n=1 Tax=Prescottella subtropica TaxID=2545757 RepID=UPI0010F80614|nr:HNH endonuclease family protein [Prescottella subtropica]